MEQVYTFHKTVQGHLHILNGFSCEDASASFSEENQHYHIAVVADGHGAKSCFRSERGSKIVTEVALNCLREFAETILCSKETEDKFYSDIFSSLRYRQTMLRHLTDRIVAGWYDRVMEDYNLDRPTLKEIGEYAAEYQKGKDVTHIYGTTVIAALCLPGCLILMQQGDGRCDVFFSDGTVKQPIPWDVRCEDTTTTSMCDEDVAERFRTHIINLKENPVAACYLGCDGIEDAYRDTYEDLGKSHEKMGGVHTFYKNLSYQISIKGINDFEAYLDEMLPEFSKNGLFSRSGSGDDVSVAGIVDMDAIGRFIGKFQREIKNYELEEKLFWKEDELRGKTRKLEILKKRMEDAKTEMEKEQAAQQRVKNVLQKFLEEQQELITSSERLKEELLAYFQEVHMTPGYSMYGTEGKSENMTWMVNGLVHKGISLLQFKNDYRVKQENYKKLLKKIKEDDGRIQMIRKFLENKREALEILEEKYREAKTAFVEYDTKYQEIAFEIKRLENEIAININGVCLNN